MLKGVAENRSLMFNTSVGPFTSIHGTLSLLCGPFQFGWRKHHPIPYPLDAFCVSASAPRTYPPLFKAGDDTVRDVRNAPVRDVRNCRLKGIRMIEASQSVYSSNEF